MATISLKDYIKLDYVEKEAYNRLRSNLQFTSDDIKVIGITSCIPGEGKSSVTMNLAASMAGADKKVLFIDGDLRKSVLLGRFKLSKPVGGLSHYLSGQKEEKDIIHSSDIDNLNLVFAGPMPPNPSELLGSRKFADFIDSVSDGYDYIFIDTPPIASVIDPAVISKVCDGMVIVIEANTISYKFARKMIQQLRKTGTKLIGTVLNKAEYDKRGYYGRYYGKYNEN